MHMRQTHDTTRNIFITRSMLSALEAKRSMAVICMTINEGTRGALLPDLNKLVANYFTCEYQLFEEAFFQSYSYCIGNQEKRPQAAQALRKLEDDAAKFAVIKLYLAKLKDTFSVWFDNNALLRQGGTCNRLQCYYTVGLRCTCGRPMIPTD